MMTFKQFVSNHPVKPFGFKPSISHIQKRLKEAKDQSEVPLMMSKWDVLKWMANEDRETVEVSFDGSGSFTLRFVEVEID